MWWLQSYYQPSLGCQSIPSSKTRGCFCNSKWWKQVLEIGSLGSLPATLDKQSTMYVTINTHNGLYVPLQMTTFWSCFRSSTFFVCHHQYSQGLVPLQTATFWSCFCAGTFSKTDWHGPAGDSAHLHIICYLCTSMLHTSLKVPKNSFSSPNISTTLWWSSLVAIIHVNRHL